MPNNPIHLAIIGCGDIVMTQHLPILLEHPRVRIAALCDRNPARAGSAAAHCPDAYPTTDYRSLLADPAIEAVLVCTPPWVTPDITIEALDAGKDVLCEKPMATTVEAARLVAEAERRSGRMLQVGFTYRHGPLMEALHGWIVSGRLGRPLQLRLSVFDEAWDPEGSPEHYTRILDTLQHGPPCLHDGAHAADYLAFLTGSRAIRVVASGQTSRPEFPSPNYNVAMIEFANGDQAKLEIGWFYPHLPAGEFQILGPLGYAYLDRANAEAVLATGRQTERIKLSENRVRSCFQAQLAEFLSSIEQRRTPVPGSREGIASLRLTLAIVEAMRTRSAIELACEEGKV